MTPAELDAIRARDAKAFIPPENDLLRSPIPFAIRDRRTLLAYVDELQAELAALRAAAAKVTCGRCDGLKFNFSTGEEPCPDCADLRKLLE